MKKIILSLITIICIMSFSGYANTKYTNATTLINEERESSYKYFYTEDVNEYLKCLQQLEDFGLEIVNIDTCPFECYSKSVEFYAITYKVNK